MWVSDLFVWAQCNFSYRMHSTIMLFRNRSDRRNREMKREKGTFIAVEWTQISLGKTFVLDFAVCSGLLMQSECIFHLIASIQTVVRKWWGRQPATLSHRWVVVWTSLIMYQHAIATQLQRHSLQYLSCCNKYEMNVMNVAEYVIVTKHF